MLNIKRYDDRIKLIMYSWLTVIAVAFFADMNIILAVAVLSVAAMCVWRRQHLFDASDLLLIGGMLSFLYFSGESIMYSACIGIGITALYHLGKSIAINDSEQGDGDNSSYMIVAISTVLFAKGLLNYSYVLRNPAVVEIEEWPNWRGVVLSKTQHEFFVILITAIAAYWILVFARHKVAALIGLICSAFGASIAIYCHGRIAFFGMVCTAIAVFAAYLIDKKLYTNRLIGGLLFGLAVIAVLFIVSYNINLFGLRDAYVHSMWSGSGGIIHNTRFTLMADTFRLLKDYPFGNCDVMLVEYNGTLTPYAHNTWLDIGKRGGVIPLVLLVAFSVTNIVSLVFVWLKSRNIEKYLLMAAFIGMTLYHMVEPAIISNPVTWCVEVFLGGLARGECILINDQEKQSA